MKLTSHLVKQLQMFCDRLSRSSDVAIALLDNEGRPITTFLEDRNDVGVLNIPVEVSSSFFTRLQLKGQPAKIAHAKEFLPEVLKAKIRELMTQQRIERFEDFLDVAADWFWETDQEHRFSFISEGISKVLGVNPTSLLGKKLCELDLSLLDEGQRPPWREQGPFLPFHNFELVWRSEGHAACYLSLNGTPFHDEQGRFLGFRGTGVNVTEARRAQENFKNLVDGSIQGIAIHRDWQLLFVNQSVTEMLGYESVEDFLKIKDITKVLAPGEFSRLKEINDARNQGFAIPRTYEIEACCKDGRVLTLNSSTSQIEWDGEPALLTTVVDITLLKEATRKLQEHSEHLQELVDERTNDLLASRERLRFIAEMTSDWFWETDENHLFTFISDRFSEVTNLKKGDVIGKDPTKLRWAKNSPKQDLESWEIHREELVHKRPFELRYWVDGLNDSQICIEIKGKPVYDKDGTFKGYLGGGRDVTEQVRSRVALEEAKEEAEKANKAKSEFLSNMSHELRTPLNAILGFAQLLERNVQGNLTESQLNHLSHIANGGEHLLELINEILDLSKIEAGKLSLSIEPVDLRALFDDIKPYADVYAQKHDVEIIDCPLAQIPYVRGDILRIKQALLNLVSNAAKYNIPGGKVWLEIEKTSPQYIRVVVRDTGPGISEQHQQKLFQPFQRFVSENNMVEGTGIGLALTKKLIEEMGGTIGLNSKVGQGSAFWFELPRAQIRKLPLPHEQTQDVEVEQRQNVASKVMLYVEDNPSNLFLMESIIESVSHIDLISARTAENGIAMAKSHSPDIILLDINLPGMNGIDAVRILKNHPVTKSIPVLALSANAMPDTILKAKQMGFDDYITKPIDLKVLLQALNGLMDER